MKKILTLAVCILLILAQMISVISCTSTDEKEDNKESSDEQTQNTDNNGENTPEIPTSSKDPSDYEKPKGVTSDFAIVCVSYKTLGKTHFINAVLSDDGNYYFILPDSVPLENVAVFIHSTKATVNYQNKIINQKITFFDFSENDTVELSVNDPINKKSKTVSLTAMTSAAPVMYLDVNEELGTVDAMHADKSKETHCYGICYVDSENNAHDTVTYFDIHGHGNSTWGGPKKKPYNIKFTEDDSYDNSRKVSLLGMRASSKWCLLADYWDKTVSRNRIAQYMGCAVEAAYGIQAQFVNLFFGAEYMGSYLALERANSIDEVLDLELTTKNNMNGSWLFEFDNQGGQLHQFSVNGVRVTPKTETEDNKYTALKAHLNEVSVALNDRNGFNKSTQKYYYDYIDLESYAKFLLVREFTLDYDTVVNHWAYYDARDQKIHAGALWDFDNSMGNGLGSRGDMEMYHDTTKLLVFQDDKGPGCWLVKLMQFKEFRDELKKQYEKYSYLFDVEDQRCIYNVAESWYDETKLLAEQNDLRWGFLSKKYEKVTGFEQDNSVFASHYGALTKFLYERCKNYGGLINGL